MLNFFKNTSKLSVIFTSILLASCGMGTSSQNPLNEVSFVPSLPEVPLPKGYEVDPTASTFYDTAEGRIAETYAAGFEDLDKVVLFYKTVMPQLGWQEIDELVFLKEGELLVLTPEEGDYLNIVEFQLKPTNLVK